ncbi:MAG: RNA polymerase sigma factor [Planctomycetota bacterium]|jgi:RNA polymerase sigma-70 factor (ECF subfamily)
MDLSEEKALIAQCRSDPQAFGRIFDTHFDAIFRFALHRVADAALAEDITSQTFYKALQSLWKFRWTGVSISAWLFRIAVNEVNGCLRRRGSRIPADAVRLEECAEDRRYQPDLELVAAEEALQQEQDFLKVHDCIAELKPVEQTLIVLRYFENKPFSEIALIMNKREGALRMRNMRALEKLEGLLKQRGIRDERYGKNTEAGSEAGGGSRIVPAKPAAQSP